MSNKLREATVLRPSLKKQATQSRIRSKDTDTKRHVTFATPKLPPPKFNPSKQQLTSDQDISKVPPPTFNPSKQQLTSDQGTSKVQKQKSVIDAHRKRIPSVEFMELRAKKNKHNEQIVRLCEAQEALIRSNYAIRRMEKESKEQETLTTTLLQEAASLIEIDVMRSFEQQRIEDFLSSIEQRRLQTTQKLREELTGFDEKIAIIREALKTIKKLNEMFDMHFTSTESKGELSVVEEMKLLSDDVNLSLSVLDSLKQFHF